jgi:Popeye protein conserved region
MQARHSFFRAGLPEMIAMQDVFPHFVHLGAMLYLVCFLFRDQILLRSFAIAGDFAYVIYYFNVADQPLWGAIFWNVPNVIINLAMIALILRDNRTTSFTDDELKLYRCLNTLTPSEFRKVVRLGKWGKTNADMVLALEGQPLGLLHYVLEGDIWIDKGGRKINASPGMFIGEIAFLKQRPASATVKIGAGSVYISWLHTDLVRAQIRHDSLKNAIAAMLNSDMAEKVALS